MVVISAFQLPSADVAAAANGVAFSSSFIALPCNFAREVALTPGDSLRACVASASFTIRHELRASPSAPPVPHEERVMLATHNAASGVRSLVSRATSQQLATRSH